MRIKSDAIDYRYFREPNIIEMDITHLLSIALKQMNQLPSEIEKQLLTTNIQPDLLNQLMDNHDAYKAFVYVNQQINNPALTAT
jgi:Asp-tRNA(Asn)/Glu-tRNA(Gln) amidotransferase B subunit